MLFPRDNAVGKGLCFGIHYDDCWVGMESEELFRAINC